MAGNNRPRGAARNIVPAVPRKYERSSTKQTVNGNETTALPSQGTSSTLRSQNNTLSMGQTTNPLIVTTPSRASVQDYGIEKHGKLPPPFYPANSSPSRPSISSDHGSPLLQPSLEAEQGDTSLMSPSDCPQWSASNSAYAGNPTPPDEDSPKPFHYSVNAKTFHPQPTPPSDMTPSPTQSSYQRFPYPHNISFYAPQTPEYADSPSSAGSLYQGYSYAPPPLMNFNYEAPVYTHDEYVNPPEQLVDGYPNGGQDSSISEPDSYNSVPKDEVADWSSQCGGPVTSRSFASSGSYSQDIPVQQTLPRPFSEADIRLSDSGQKLDGGFSKPIDMGAEQDATEGYDVWRKIALDDLRTVPEEVCIEQMTMPSFFLQHFDNTQYADCRLRITVKDKASESFDLLLHRVLLTYSPTLAAKLESAEPDIDGLSLIVLDAAGNFITPDAIKSALYTCYGRPLCDFIGTTSKISVSFAQDSATWMGNALAFVAAGQLLGLPAVVARGLQIATRILNWDNIEKALSFALEGLTQNNLDSVDNVSLLLRGVEIRNGVKKDDLSVDQRSGLNSTLSDTGPTITDYEVHLHSTNAEPLIVHCVRMIIDYFPKGWTVDPSTHSMSSIDRLPEATTEPRNGPKSRLSRIQFGSLSSGEDDEAPKSTDQNPVLSSIMLSLPFGLIDHIVSRLQQYLTAESLKALIDERERRRQTVLQEKPECGTRNSGVALGWQEYLDTVTDEQGPRIRISRRWIGPE